MKELLLASVVMHDVALALGKAVPLALPLAQDLYHALPAMRAIQGIIAQQHLEQGQQAAFARVPFAVDI